MITLTPESRLAVIGGGVAGITASFLLDSRCQVTLFEKNDYVGGHTHTHEITEGPDAGARVDSGFIVMNNRTYPLLTKLLGKLGVGIRNTDMSFGYWDHNSQFQYSGNGIGGMLADVKNLTSRRWWRMVRDILRFEKVGLAALQSGVWLQHPLGDFLRHHELSDDFRDHYLVPMGASIWSTSNEEMLEFPTGVFLEFFRNHGLLNLRERPQWQTVEGGSSSYVKAFLKGFRGQVQTQAKIQHVERSANGVTLVHADGRREDFDGVVFAVHADEVLPLLHSPSPEEMKLFSPWKYQRNEAVLHHHEPVLPPRKRAWASWNFTRETESKQRNPVSIAYDMNRLQGLHTKHHWLVSLNRLTPIPAQDVYKSMVYFHPTYKAETVETRPGILALNGQRHTYYVGSYFGYGFHEDAVRSSVELMQKHFGIQL